MKRYALVLAVLAFLLLTSNALALSSANYRLDWFVPVTGSAGSPSSSANYAVQFTIGQTSIGTSASTNYEIGSGFWYGVGDLVRTYLPFIRR
jgi:hypothetical protein